MRAKLRCEGGSAALLTVTGPAALDAPGVNSSTVVTGKWEVALCISILMSLESLSVVPSPMFGGVLVSSSVLMSGDTGFIAVGSGLVTELGEEGTDSSESDAVNPSMSDFPRLDVFRMSHPGVWLGGVGVCTSVQDVGSEFTAGVPDTSDGPRVLKPQRSPGK